VAERHIQPPAERSRAEADLVLYGRHGPAAVLTFNRPDKLNALSSAMLDRFEERLDQAEAASDIRVVVLTGAGDRAFIVGADIHEYGRRSDVQFQAYQRRSRSLFSRLAAFGKPVIAAVNGRRSSRTSARSLRSSADSSLLTPGGLPTSTSAWRTRLCSVSADPICPRLTW
jgi:1,4-dihydroxy-2-naphthoyl-CoA synthase